MRRRYVLWAAALALGGCKEREEAPAPKVSEGPRSHETIIAGIQSLESDRDPKCHATASRLEDFMFGTPLSDGGRLEKLDQQTALVRRVWQKAGDAARTAKKTAVDEATLFAATVEVRPMKAGPTGVQITIPTGQIRLSKRDIEHYGSVAFSLRAILAVEQETAGLLPLEPAASAVLSRFVDIVTLAALQVADVRAREADSSVLSAKNIAAAFDEVLGDASAPVASAPASGDRGVFQRIVKQKVASYRKYNAVSSQVFLRNLQVYFARRSWPKDKGQAATFQKAFTETMVQLGVDLASAASDSAKARKQAFIRAEDVMLTMHRFGPFEVNQYEDVTFFGRLPRAQQVTLEAYDVDAFRDSGLHWRFLEWGLDETDVFLEPDPFAAELLAETVAQLGLLILRMAGDFATERGDEEVHVDHLNEAVKRIQARIQASDAAKPGTRPAPKIASSAGRTPSKGLAFTDVTEPSGVDFMHRSADWLSRLLRSYLTKTSSVGTLSIPPAFGGGGVAAEDVTGDGRADILLVGGAGLELYEGLGEGRFADITAAAGLVYKRPDGNFGEPRQPLIADFDNDGDQDILITYVDDDHRLYANAGNGRFQDVSAASNLGGRGLVGGPAVAFDYDRDGLLDVYIGYFGDYPRGALPTLSRRNFNGQANKLFRNLGGLRFEDVTKGSGVDNTGWTQAASHTDLDGDGWQDLIVGNDFGINAYLRNLGNGRFEDVSAKLGVDKPSFTMNVGLADLNADGHPDVYISNIVTMVKDDKYVSPSKDTPAHFDPASMARMRVVEANDLFISRTKGGRLVGFDRSMSVGRGKSSTGWAWDADFFDYDLDGDDDLYCLNGMNDYRVYSEQPYYTSVLDRKETIQLVAAERERNVFFINEGGALKNASEGSGLDFIGNSRSAAYLDFDDDGDLDVVVNDYHGSARVFRNELDAGDRRWVMLRLRGDPSKGSNRDAIGARITIDAGDRTIWREVHGSIGYLSAHPKVVHAGVGVSPRVDVTVRWPNGETSRHPGLTTNQKHLIAQ